MNNLRIILSLLVLILSITVHANDNLNLVETKNHWNRYKVKDLKKFLQGKTITYADILKGGKKVCTDLNIDKNYNFDFLKGSLKGKVLFLSKNKLEFDFSNTNIPNRVLELKSDFHISSMAKTNPHYKGSGFTLNTIKQKKDPLVRIAFINCYNSHNCRRMCSK